MPTLLVVNEIKKPKRVLAKNLANTTNLTRYEFVGVEIGPSIIVLIFENSELQDAAKTNAYLRTMTHGASRIKSGTKVISLNGLMKIYQ